MCSEVASQLSSIRYHIFVARESIATNEPFAAQLDANRIMFYFASETGLTKKS